MLIRDEGYLFKMLHKAVSERDEEERAMFRDWARDFMVAEMAVRGAQDGLWNALYLAILEGWRGDFGAYLRGVTSFLSNYE